MMVLSIDGFPGGSDGKESACNVRAAAAKSLQSCPTLQPHRQQPTRLPHPWDSPGKNTGVGCHFLLQCMKVKVKVKSLSRVRLLATTWTAAYQAPLSMGFFRQEYWSGMPLPSLAMWETWVQSLGWEDPLEESMATHSRILACRIPMDR